MGFYSTDPSDFIHDDVDTAFFLAATSWFNPAGQADDWFSFGPLTIPAAGAAINYAVKWNPAWRDGYKIHVSTTGMSNYTDFVAAPIYTVADLNPNPNDAADTIWSYRTIDIPASYNGSLVYIGFQHDASDMDVLYIDEVSVIEKSATGIKEEFINGVKLCQNQPNPVAGNTLIQYEIQNNASVSLEIYDITGRLALSYNEGNQIAGKHNIFIDAGKLNMGTYFYTLKVDNTRLTKKMVVTQ